MVILKTKISNSLALACCLIMAFASVTLNYVMAIDDTTQASCSLVSKLSLDEIPKEIERLQKRLKRCTDRDNASKIKYRIGLLYFKDAKLDRAESIFDDIANDKDASLLIRICGLNMSAQTARLFGDDRRTLEIFDKLIHLCSRNISDSQNKGALEYLHCSALVSKTELYELRQKYDLAIEQYRLLLELLGDKENENLTQKFGPSAYERLAQLYLRYGNYESYHKAIANIKNKFPDYKRMPILELEAESVGLIADSDLVQKWSRKSSQAPAIVAGTLVIERDKDYQKKVAHTFETLCQKYQDSEWTILLNYHYAWLLDSINDDDKASVVLDKIYSAKSETTLKGTLADFVPTLKAYAAIQNAIILAERQDCKKALNVLKKIELPSNHKHLSKLKESVIKSTQILKREVPKK
jgi:tetratricopeptide (TPR) repeat protein